MIRDLFSDLLIQNQVSCQFAFSELTPENVQYKLTDHAASAGFIYRHIGETMILFGYFFGFPPDVPNTTMGATDIGQGDKLEESRVLVEKGYALLKTIVDESSDSEWQNEIKTRFSAPSRRPGYLPMYFTIQHTMQGRFH